MPRKYRHYSPEYGSLYEYSTPGLLKPDPFKALIFETRPKTAERIVMRSLLTQLSQLVFGGDTIDVNS